MALGYNLIPRDESNSLSFRDMAIGWTPSRCSFCFALTVVLLGLWTRPLSGLQADVVGVLDREIITAGTIFNLRVKFDTAPSYATSVQAFYNYQANPNAQIDHNPVQIACYGETVAGQREVAMRCSAPNDADGGNYEAAGVNIGPPPGSSRGRYLKAALPSVVVEAIQDKNSYPTLAAGELDLTQAQLLQSGASRTGQLLDRLNTQIDGHSAETDQLKTVLARTAKQGFDELERTRKSYAATLGAGKQEPIFFEDFARQYKAYITELNTPRRAQVSSRSGSRFLEVQASRNESINVTPDRLDSSLGPFVTQLAALLGNQLAAFMTVSNSGATTFAISLRSSPPGATVTYKRIGEEYQEYSRTTDIERADFPYALWTFRFTFGKCEIVKRPNPYIEKSPNLNVSFTDCTKK